MFLFVAQDKWDKAKTQVEEIIAMIKINPNRLDHKHLEQVWGFLQYVTHTYSGMTPYMIGFHLTIDGWRGNRLDTGWRKKDSLKGRSSAGACGDGGAGKEMLTMEQTLSQTREDMDLGSSLPEEVPKFDKAVPHFLPDLLALRALMSCENPPLKRARCSKVATAIYSFVDASGRGFESTIQVGSKVFFQYGQWPSPRPVRIG